MPNFCPNCGAKLAQNVKFCSDCGTPVSSDGAPTSQNTVASTKSIDELQNELYSLYEILGPIKELDLAGSAVDEKIAELSEPLPKAREKFYDDFAHYFPFISVDLDEDFITPTDKFYRKQWKLFIKNQKNKLYGKKYMPTAATKYGIEIIYDIFEKNLPKVMSDLGASFLYYKMDYCYNPNVKPLIYKRRYDDIDPGVMSPRRFVFDYLKNKLGNNYDAYLYDVLTKLKGGNKGETELHDIPGKYDLINQAEFHDNLDKENEYDWFYLREGFPKTKIILGNILVNLDEIEKAAKAAAVKSMKVKVSLDDALTELRKIRAEINASIDKYMVGVNEYIGKNVKITPFAYASQWRSVSYFLHLIVNRRGRDIYEIVNQYEVDMKHQELTAALGDIHTEISNQTHVLASKLDDVKRAVVNMTSAITGAIAAQTSVLKNQLENINYSVISTGASVAGSIAQLGASMGQAMSSMRVSISV